MDWPKGTVAVAFAVVASLLKSHELVHASIANTIRRLIGISRTPLQCIGVLHMRLCVHIVIFAVVIIFRRRMRLLLLQKLFAIERTGRIKFEPRPYAVQIEEMVLVAGQLDDKRILVYSTIRVSQRSEAPFA